jgi:hypothetical protein
MKAMLNRTHIEGYLYEHALEKKVTGPNSKNPGTEFITGTISIATDEACLNVVPVHFTYTTAMTGSGKPNATFSTLENVINGTYKTCMADGKDVATKLRIDSAIGLNEFFSDRNGTEELVSAKRNEGGFVHVVTDGLAEDEKTRNTFECDILITNVRHVDADDDKHLPEKCIIKGAIFDFRKSLMPVEFTAINPNAINYFESLEASSSNPTFTKVWGRQVSETIVRTITEESAFGDASVREVKSSRKDWVVTGAKAEPYDWDDESTLTAAEVNEAIKARELTLAAMKARQDEYKASKGAQPAKASNTPAAGVFNF